MQICVCVRDHSELFTQKPNYLVVNLITLDYYRDAGGLSTLCTFHWKLCKTHLRLTQVRYTDTNTYNAYCCLSASLRNTMLWLGGMGGLQQREDRWPHVGMNNKCSGCVPEMNRHLYGETSDSVGYGVALACLADSLSTNF